MQLKQRAKIFTLGMVGIFITFRIFLYFFPFTNTNVGLYNIHHLYTGAFLLILTTVALLLGMVNRFTVILAGISSGLVLDEIVYLITTDGSDLSYNTQASFIGAVVLITLVLIWTWAAYSKTNRN